MTVQFWQGLRTGSDQRSTFLRYIIVGFSIFALDFAVFLIFASLLDWDVRPSQALARTAGALAGFFGHKYFSFGNDSQSRSGSAALQGGAYLLVTVLNIVISPFIVFGAVFLVQGMPGALILGKVLAEGVLVMETYILLHFIFVRRR